MRPFVAGALAGLAILSQAQPRIDAGDDVPAAPAAICHRSAEALAPDLASEELTDVVQRYCQVCHNDQLLAGNLSLQGFDVANPVRRAADAEKMIQKLRVGM